MAWESRGKSGKMVYYQSVRGPDGRVLKRYLGSGEGARQVAEEAERSRQVRDAQRLEVENEIARLRAVEDVTARVTDAALLLMAAVLLAEGMHRPNHGPWRRKR